MSGICRWPRQKVGDCACDHARRRAEGEQASCNLAAVAVVRRRLEKGPTCMVGSRERRERT